MAGVALLFFSFPIYSLRLTGSSICFLLICLFMALRTRNWRFEGSQGRGEVYC